MTQPLPPLWPSPRALPTVRGRVVRLAIGERILADNPLGDPVVRDTAVWLPPSYDSADDRRRYPVVYWLAGYAGDGHGFFQGSPWQLDLGERLSALVTERKMGELIVVAPNCFTRLGGSQYVDSPSVGRYATYLTDEVIPTVDRAFRTLPVRESRAIGGKSSGGFGALLLAMDRPDLFGGVVSHAGDMAFELSLLPEVGRVVRVLRKHGGPVAFLRYFEALPRHRHDDVSTMMMLALAAAYTPDSAQPLGLQLPFHWETGELIPEIWARWKAWDPLQRLDAPARAQALAAMKLIYLDAGTRDEWFLDLGARLFSRKLSALGIAHEHEEFEDTHSGTSYRYAHSFPKLAAAMDAPRLP